MVQSKMKSAYIRYHFQLGLALKTVRRIEAADIFDKTKT